MSTSLLCVYEGHDGCEMPNCACSCHAAFREDTLRILDDHMVRLAPSFPEDDLSCPPVTKALEFVSKAVRFYCSVPIDMDNARALIQAERILGQILCPCIDTLEVANDEI